jgi:ribosomal protein L37AE/L43A
MKKPKMVTIQAAICPSCCSTDTYRSDGAGSWRCLRCSAVWERPRFKAIQVAE